MGHCRRVSRVVLGLALLMLPLVARATDRYVGPAGTGTSGCTNPASPCAFTSATVNGIAAGDTLYMRGGTYTLSTYISITTSGSSGNLKRLFNYPGETPVIDAINLTTEFHSAMQASAISWWHFKGLEIKNAPAHGLYLSGGCTNVTVEHNYFHHNVRLQASGAGFTSDNASDANLLILNNDASNNSEGNAAGSGGDGIGVNYSQGGGNVIRGNRTWHNQDDGLDVWCCNGCLVEQNWSWQNGYDDALTPSPHNGAGFKLGGNEFGTCGNNTVRQNLSWGNKESGYDDNSGTLPSTLYNNTGYNHTNVGQANFAYYSAIAHVLRNNLAVTNNTAPSSGSLVQDHNSWNGGVTATAADFVTTDFTANTGPRQADGSLPASTFLTLAPGSDLIDKGVDVGLPFSGAAPDLGASEFSAGSPAPSVLRVVR